MDGMEKVQKIMGNVRVRIAAAGVLTAAVAGTAVLTAFSGSGKEENTQSQYKETTVERGDIVVGVTESGTASIQAVPVGFDEITVTSSSNTGNDTRVSATVEKLFVKPGQEVKEGDAIAQLSTDGFADTLDELRMDLQKAQISLRSAQLNLQLDGINAANTLRQNQAKQETAELQYEITLKTLANDLATSQLTLEDLQNQIDDYEELLAGDMRDDYDLDSLEADYDAAVDDLNDLEDRIDDYEHGDITLGESSTPSSLNSELSTAKQRVSSAKTALRNAEEKYEQALEQAKSSLKSLYNSYEQKSLAYDSQEASMTLSELNAAAERDEDLATAENAEDLYEVEIAQKENALASEQLSVQTIEKKIAALEAYENEDGMLYAPCSGLVMSMNYEEGDTVDWDAQIAVVANAKNVYLYVSIAQEDISSISIGKPVNVSMGAYDGEKFTGVVDSITTTPARSDASTVSYSVKVKLDGDTTAIYEGMTGEVTFITKEITDVLYVSNRAITAEDGRQYVQVRGEDGEVVRKEIETGFSDGRNVEVVSGLAEGDVVLIEAKVETK